MICSYGNVSEIVYEAEVIGIGWDDGNKSNRGEK